MRRKIEKLIWSIALLWSIAAFWPASFWYAPGVMQVNDIRHGEILVLLTDATAKRSFLGSYSVVVRNTDFDKVVGEARGGPFEYFVGATRPIPLTINWWAPSDPRMHQLPPGHYRLHTCWTVLGRFWGVVPGKTVCNRSNIFTIFPN